MLSFCEILPLYQIFKLVREEKDIYGEVSEEFSFIILEVEFLGHDVVTAMRNLISTTPSENLKEFLEGLLIAFESGENLKNYMLAKVNHFKEEARKRSELNLKILGTLAEVYVVLFVALPIFLMVLIFSMRIVGKSIGFEYYLYLYVFLPMGSLLLSLIIDAVNVKEDLSITKLIKKRSNFSSSIISHSSTLENISKKRKNFIDFLTSIYAEIKKNYYKSTYFSLILLSSFVLVSLKTPLNPSYFETYFLIAVMLFLIPLSIAFEYRARLVRKVEKDIPIYLEKF